jgi:hypothetical protein
VSKAESFFQHPRQEDPGCVDYATDFDVTALDAIDDAMALERRVPIRHPSSSASGMIS